MPAKGSIEIVDIIDDCDWKVLQGIIATSHPDVLLLGSQKLDKELVDGLEKVRFQFACYVPVNARAKPEAISNDISD